MKFFNTEGPVNMEEYYKIDPLKRWDMQEVLDLIDMRKYFIIHAPRQTGKTSCLLALRDYLNAEGKYFAVYINVEPGQAARHEVRRVMKAIIVILKKKLVSLKVDEAITDKILPLFEESDGESGLGNILTYLCNHIHKPIVLMVDEIDALVGDSLVSVLRQLREGYESRPADFPSSIMLCGVRDVKDYRIQTSGKDIITGGSAFNIKAESLRLGDFTFDEVVELLTQHTTETGQRWAEGCFERVMEYSDGQPWLVNALAFQVTHKMKANRDRSIVITPEMIDIAKENLILERQTHLDQLAFHLHDIRVRGVVEAAIIGDKAKDQEDDDLRYCTDLGLIKKVNGAYKISNAIYAEVIPRELNHLYQTSFLTQFKGGWLAPDGSLNIEKLLSMYKEFWVENSHIWRKDIAGYKEAAPHLVIQAYLQRVINGGGEIRREYALDSSRFDIFITWDYKIASGNETITKTQKFIIELKTIKTGEKYETIRKQALQQTAEYAHVCGITDNAHIIVFDRDFQESWDTQAPNERVEHDGVKLEIWKM